MKKLFAALAAFALLLILGGALAGALGEPSYNPAEYARQQAEADRIARQADIDAALTPLDLALAAAWRVLPLVAVAGGLVYLGAWGVAHQIRFRRERWPNDAGLLPVEAEQLATVAPQALGAFHAARQLEASHQPVPHTVTYSPHATHAPRLDYRHAGAEGPGALVEPPALALPGLTDLGALGFTPSRESILLALGENGERITVPAKGLCHVALVGATGGGKSNLLRLLLPQLQAIGARVVLADPHFAPLDPESGDDWRPIAERLHMAPAVKPGEIGALLDYLTEELGRRLDLRNAGQPVGPPLFFAFDELPVIADTVPGALDTLGKIVREGRKVHLLAVGASQTMLVKAIGGDSTIRDNYRTAFYVGGDLKSGAALLDMPQRDIDDGQLQTGIAYLRSAATAPARLVRVPYASNEAIAALLGAPSVAASAAPSAAPSEGRPIGFRPARPEGRPEGANEGANAAPLPAHSNGLQWTPEEARIVAALAAGKKPGELAEEMSGAKGGSKYQAAAAKIAAVIARLAGQGVSRG